MKISGPLGFLLHVSEFQPLFQGAVEPITSSRVAVVVVKLDVKMVEMFSRLYKIK